MLQDSFNLRMWPRFRLQPGPSTIGYNYPLPMLRTQLDGVRPRMSSGFRCDWFISHD
jgi:hypothetical protein